MGIYTQEDKLMTLSEAMKLVSDGDKVAIGGGLILREPIAAIYELIRQRKRNLHLIGTAHGFDVDVACGGGIVGKEQHTYVAYEFVYRGGCPNFRRVVEQGLVEEKEDGCYAVIQGLRAAAYGLPFYPSTCFFGTDVLKYHPEYKEFACPVTGRKLVAIPPIEPDVAILHVHKADRRGNAATGAPLVADILMARAAKKLIITAEELVSEEWFRERQGATIPYYETTAVVHVPFGAHPTCCYLYYTYDKDFLDEYIEYARRDLDAAAKGERGTWMEEWLNKYVYDVSREEYLERIGGEKKLEKLKNWKQRLFDARVYKEQLAAEWEV